MSKDLFGLNEFELMNIVQVKALNFRFCSIPCDDAYFCKRKRWQAVLKQLAGDIITSLPKYQTIRKYMVSDCLEFFDDHGFFIDYQRGIGLRPEIVRKLLPLAGSHLQLINAAYGIEKSRGYRPTTERLWEALLDLGDLTLINPVLPDFEENYRYDFLTKLPFYLPYKYLEQWDSVLLSQDTGLYFNKDLNRYHQIEHR